MRKEKIVTKEAYICTTKNDRESIVFEQTSLSLLSDINIRLFHRIALLGEPSYECAGICPRYVTERTGMLLANLRRPQNLSEKEEVFDVLPYSLVCRFTVVTCSSFIAKPT